MGFVFLSDKLDCLFNSLACLVPYVYEARTVRQNQFKWNHNEQNVDFVAD